MDFDSTEMLMYYAENGITAYGTIAPMGGLSTPLSLAGMLTLMNAEWLATATLAQMSKAGTPLIYNFLPVFADMRDGAYAPGAIEIGYWIHVDHIRQGLATELTRALTTVAFGQPDIDRVEIHHDMANVASGRVPALLGYELAAEEDREIATPGEAGVTWIWVMERGDWERQVNSPTS